MGLALRASRVDLARRRLGAERSSAGGGVLARATLRIGSPDRSGACRLVRIGYFEASASRPMFGRCPNRTSWVLLGLTIWGIVSQSEAPDTRALTTEPSAYSTPPTPSRRSPLPSPRIRARLSRGGESG